VVRQSWNHPTELLYFLADTAVGSDGGVGDDSDR